VVEDGAIRTTLPEPEERVVRFVPGNADGVPTSFWDKAESLVLTALDEFVSFASHGDRFQRQLFADDTKRELGSADILPAPL
jgi:hypothetical protein